MRGFDHATILSPSFHSLRKERLAQWPPFCVLNTTKNMLQNMNLAAYASESNEQNFEVYWKTRIVDQRSRIGLKKLEIKPTLDKSWIVTMLLWVADCRTG